jgi:adenylate kinase family enzyme
MKRVIIIGQPGSGKSTLARNLAKTIGVPAFHMDQIHWMPGWIERPIDEKFRLAREVYAKDEWVFEGGFSQTWDERLARADTLIWLDTHWVIRSWRVTFRTLRGYGKSRPDLPENCPERFSAEFYKWIWDTRHSGRARMRKFYNFTDKPKHRFTSFTQSNAFLDGLAA